MSTTGTRSLRARPSEHAGRLHRVVRRHPWRTAALGVLAVVLLAATVPLAVAGLPMLQGRDALERARDALAVGDLDEAGDGLQLAESRFRIARVALRNPIARIGAVVPVLGHTSRTAAELALAGELTAGSGAQVAEAVRTLPGGIQSLTPSGGRVPVRAIEALEPSLSQAAGAFTRAQEAVDAAPSVLLLGPVADAREQMQAELADVTPAIVAGAALAEALPGFLGADGPRRYFFGASQIAELRGVGGFMGAYAILEVDDGTLSFGPFRTIHELPGAVAGAVEPPSPQVGERYARYGGVGDWVNIGITSDFPAVGTIINRLYSETVGEELDGAIVADPFALAALLEVAGPTEVPGLGTVDHETVVPFVANEAFALFEGQQERQQVLGAVAAATLQGFLRQGGGGEAAAEATAALAGAVRGRHLLLYSDHADEQEAFERARVAGTLSADGDLVELSVNSSANAKVDYYLEPALDYTVRLRPDGGASGRITVVFTNSAPVEGPPRYVIGPNRPGFEAGENRFFATVACARGCVFDAFSRDGQLERRGALDRERDHELLTTPVRLASGQSETLEATWEVPGDVWQEDAGHLTYRLTLRTPPTVTPTAVRATVPVPAGFEVVRAPDMELRNGALAFEDDLRGERTLEIELARPEADRIRQGIRDFLSRPLVRVGGVDPDERR